MYSSICVCMTDYKVTCELIIIMNHFHIWLLYWLSHILEQAFMESGGRLNIEMWSYQYRDPHVKDTTVLRSSYLSHGNPHTCERQRLGPGSGSNLMPHVVLVVIPALCFHFVRLLHIWNLWVSGFGRSKCQGLHNWHLQRQHLNK